MRISAVRHCIAPCSNHSCSRSYLQLISLSSHVRKMAGVGRRTHYRKHLTDSVLHDFPEPTEHERIAKVVATRGGNQFEILLANNSKVKDVPSTDRKATLAMLPSKFRKLVWLRRNDFVIVQTGGEDDDTRKGIRFIITHILYKEQVRHLQTKDLWPTNDVEFGDVSIEGIADLPDDAEQSGVNENDVGDGIVYDTEMNDDDMFVNTNQNQNRQVAVPDSSDSEDEE